MRRITCFLILVCTVALASAAGTTRSAHASLLPFCGATSQVFLPWGDSASYYFATNGGFESGTYNWKISGAAKLASQNDPYQLSGPGDTSLTLAAGGTASMNVCYGLTYPAVRFVAAGVNGSARIHVRVVSHGLLGILSVLDGGSFTVPSGWDAAPKLSTLFSALTAPLSAGLMEIRITVESGTAQLDDLYVDPFLTRA